MIDQESIELVIESFRQTSMSLLTRLKSYLKFRLEIEPLYLTVYK